MIIEDSRLIAAKDLVSTDINQALDIINDVLNDSPEDPQGLFMAGYILMENDKWGLAYSLYKRCEDLYPPYAEVYNNMGMCLEFVDHDEALRCFNKALEIDPCHANAIANKGLIKSYMGDPKACIDLSTKALELDPKFEGAKHNRAYSRLMLRDWARGWDEYQLSLGSKSRSGRDYHVPSWDGVTDGNVVVYRDQGLGDEIFFAECIEDAKKHANIILDVSPRLKNLFERSFNVPTYGTGFEKETPLVKDYKIDYQCALGDLPRFYRRDDANFTGRPYLKSDDLLGKLYQKELKPGINVGLAWTGGLSNTHRRARCIDLADFGPIYDLGFNIISLEYNQPSQDELERYGIQHLYHAVDRSVDHDHTAALISQLDFIITVPTTVMHTAGGLGVRTYCLTPKYPSWRFHLDGDYPWNESVELVRQVGSWADTIATLAKRIEDEQSIHRSRSETADSLPRTG